MDGPELIGLSRGRTLAFEEWGDPDGGPVVYCHGFPDSRVSAQVLDRAADAAGLRLIAPDRPGIGASGYRQRRRIRDWADDVTALASALGLERFALLGRGAGAPYALACAHDLPERVTAVGLASPVAPPSVVRGSLGPARRLWFDAVSYLPLARLPAVRHQRYRLARDPAALLREQAETGPPADRRSLRAVADSERESHQRAFRQGLWGPLRETTLLRRGWGFRLEGVTRPVLLWHGRADPVVPVARAERVAERLPDCAATFYDDDGHHSVLVDHDDEILRALAERADRTAAA
jgi:pimeloyl-ACP methyl ester carboxylesterase